MRVHVPNESPMYLQKRLCCVEKLLKLPRSAPSILVSRARNRKSAVHRRDIFPTACMARRAPTQVGDEERNEILVLSKFILQLSAMQFITK